jgi:hypothetical protein
LHAYKAPGGCCGGLSTLRGTPPQHLFDVDLFWNDPRDSNSAFKHRSILKMCLESLWVALGVSWTPFWELWGSILEPKIVNLGLLGGPWHREKTRPKKELQKVVAYPMAWTHFGDHFGIIFNDFSIYFPVRFSDDFWSDLGDILGAKMEPKSINNQSKFDRNFG